MSICKIFYSPEYSNKKIECGTIKNHYNTSKWLEENGKKNEIYNVCKGHEDSLHSVWIWKENSERWGRTATPSKNSNVIKPPIEEYSSIGGKKQRKIDRQIKAKTNYSEKRHRS